MCADGRSCEFFLMCWMTAGLLDGSCGGIMYACCQRKDPKALTDYNLIESPRDQSRPLPLDLYTETASDDRKSFLRKACRPYSSIALGSMRSTLVSLFSLSFSCSSSSFLSIVSIFVNYFTTLHHSLVFQACILTSSHIVFYLEKLHNFLAGCLPFIVLNPFFLLIT